VQIHPPADETLVKIRAAIEAAIPDGAIEVAGAAGHFEIRVTSKVFEGKNSLSKQRIVYSAIAHLMKGDEAPVHAVDKLETLVP